MKLSYLLLASAVYYAVFGVAFLLAASLVIGLFGGMSMEPLTDHLLGAGLVALAVLNWFALREPGHEPARGVVAANLVFNAIGFVEIGLQELAGGPNVLGWIPAVISLVLALGFAYVLFLKPSVESNRSTPAL